MSHILCIPEVEKPPCFTIVLVSWENGTRGPIGTSANHPELLHVGFVFPSKNLTVVARDW